MTPLPVADSFDALNARFLHACTRRGEAILRGHTNSIAERMRADLAALMPLPPAPYDACHKVATRVSSLSLVRYRNTDDSVPTRYGHQEVLVKGYVDRVEIACRGETIATHVRSYDRADFVYDRCIIWRCWNARAERLIRRRRWTGGNSPNAYIGCAD